LAWLILFNAAGRCLNLDVLLTAWLGVPWDFVILSICHFGIPLVECDLSEVPVVELADFAKKT